MKNKTYQYSTERYLDRVGNFEVTVEYTVSRGSPYHWSYNPELYDEGSPDEIEDVRMVYCEIELSDEVKALIADDIVNEHYDELIENTLDWEN
jgi:hypothetical protein